MPLNGAVISIGHMLTKLNILVKREFVFERVDQSDIMANYERKLRAFEKNN